MSTKVDITGYDRYRIVVIGLGYVGLPLAVEFAKKFNVIGFDTNANRVNDINAGLDKTLEVSAAELNTVLNRGAFNGLVCTSSEEDITDGNIYIITVPTPVDNNKKPDLRPLFTASEIVGRKVSKNDIVVYESTVYPGLTEDECVPIIEAVSGLKYNDDFFVGYSPERINPGDKLIKFSNIIKITSGSTPEVADIIDNLYRSVVTAGTFKAASIKVAEAAKVVENVQRDVNIAFMNELAQLFNQLGIDTHDVLEAAGTKWNFINFKPGLAGGHCVGVDSYYLLHKAVTEGYQPDLIATTRRLNDSMGKFVAAEVINLLKKKQIEVKGAKALILGITFKENCPDIRNTKVVDIYNDLIASGVNITVADPWAEPDEVQRYYGFKSEKHITGNEYDAVVIAVAHDQFISIDLTEICKPSHVIYDVKGVLSKDRSDARL